MSDQPLALSTVPPIDPAERDYEAICSAVRATARGRWFLDEYARRNRSADTSQVLAAIERIAAAIADGGVQHADQSLRLDLFEMARAIAQARAIASESRPQAQFQVVEPAFTPRTSIASAAERLRDIALSLRAGGVELSTSEQIEQIAQTILSAASLRDPMNDRAQKLTEVLHYLEHRIERMLDRHIDADVIAEHAVSTPDRQRSGWNDDAAAAKAALIADAASETLPTDDVAPEAEPTAHAEVELDRPIGATVADGEGIAQCGETAVPMPSSDGKSTTFAAPSSPPEDSPPAGDGAPDALRESPETAAATPPQSHVEAVQPYILDQALGPELAEPPPMTPGALFMAPDVELVFTPANSAEPESVTPTPEIEPAPEGRSASDREPASGPDGIATTSQADDPLAFGVPETTLAPCPDVIQEPDACTVAERHSIAASDIPVTPESKAVVAPDVPVTPEPETITPDLVPVDAQPAAAIEADSVATQVDEDLDALANFLPAPRAAAAPVGIETGEPAAPPAPSAAPTTEQSPERQMLAVDCETAGVAAPDRPDKPAEQPPVPSMWIPVPTAAAEAQPASSVELECELFAAAPETPLPPAFDASAAATIPSSVIAAQAIAATTGTPAPAQPAQPAARRPAGDPFAALNAMTDAERIALFT